MDDYCLLNENKKRQESGLSLAGFPSPKRQGDYQGYRGGASDRPAGGMPVLLGAGLIAIAILLSTLISSVTTRFIGMDSPSEDNMWLIDRLTGSVYKCQASERGKASCEPDTATGSIGERQKH
jgi:hypothetical protein